MLRAPANKLTVPRSCTASSAPNYDVAKFSREESCLDSITLKIASRLAKRGQLLVRLIMYVHALSAAKILCGTVD